MPAVARFFLTQANDEEVAGHQHLFIAMSLSQLGGKKEGNNRF
jgi:hypothetical protein